MLTSLDYPQLDELLAFAGHQDQVLNRAELLGFLHGLVITPEAIQPSEWLPQVFGEEIDTFTDQEQGERFLKGVLDVYNQINHLHLQGQLHFPYCLKEPSEETVSNALDWGFGFNLALEMRPEIWLGNGPVDNQDEDDNLFASFSVVNAIAWPNEPDEGCLDQPTDESELLATLLLALPNAVAVIQSYAAQLQTRPAKIGRNEPCPCGSGQKFNTCCSDDRTTLH
ncbi:MAG: hypothetical protein BA870_00305 [Desulfuromonadales bacterium C00003094]|jgi:uncharacterized protein|nr:MAG: hypothetical protein BA870_00305 [Desulfuromonadales bacterium C00003094]OEU72181.1 MAG: hypothetical protein BA869_05185 [Desulfuromonadales bacterium C00003107]